MGDFKRFRLDPASVPNGEHWCLVVGEDATAFDDMLTQVRAVRMCSNAADSREAETIESISLGVEELEWLLPVLMDELTRLRKSKLHAHKLEEWDRGYDSGFADCNRSWGVGGEDPPDEFAATKNPYRREA